jgi:hypothetical protein
MKELVAAGWSDDTAELLRRTQTLQVNAGALSVG